MTLGIVVSALVTGAAGKVGEETAEGTAGVLGRLAGCLQQRFSHETQDEKALLALAQAIEVPDSPRRLQLLAEFIGRHVEEDAGFGTELERLIREARANGIDDKSVSQIARGEQIVQSQGVENSTITVTLGHQGPSSS